MICDLILPKPGATEQTKEDKTFKLTWTTDHAQSSYGLGVLLYKTGEILDGATFLGLRDGVGAFIVTTRPEKVCGALGVPLGEDGIIPVDDPRP